jgi:hypothetical protein
MLLQVNTSCTLLSACILHTLGDHSRALIGAGADTASCAHVSVSTENTNRNNVKDCSVPFKKRRISSNDSSGPSSLSNTPQASPTKSALAAMLAPSSPKDPAPKSPAKSSDVYGTELSGAVNLETGAILACNAEEISSRLVSSSEAIGSGCSSHPNFSLSSVCPGTQSNMDRSVVIAAAALLSSVLSPQLLGATGSKVDPVSSFPSVEAESVNAETLSRVQSMFRNAEVRFMAAKAGSKWLTYAYCLVLL